MKQLLLVFSFMIALSAAGNSQSRVFLGDELAAQNVTLEAKVMHDLDRANPTLTVTLTGDASPDPAQSDFYAYFEYVLEGYAQEISESGNSLQTYESYTSGPLFQAGRIPAQAIQEARVLILDLVSKVD